ncbi:hypothetical protein JG687_00010830 [Phytophthora cactorum]|uniref:Uncharacterized protein n=1 Tax=Phytophthora cactorum TaxID=29920 RepID=A0A8T1U8G5_9STRA|nr:hypothetical protein JG687_00010830 [Phytophthora cactorum]
MPLADTHFGLYSTAGQMRLASTLSVMARYGINIDQYSRFMVSDTTGSARNVSDQFEDTDQVDCLMHLPSLCLLYALGMKEYTRDNGKTVVTPVYEFRNGCCVLQKLRNLATFLLHLFDMPSSISSRSYTFFLLSTFRLIQKRVLCTHRSYVVVLCLYQVH